MKALFVNLLLFFTLSGNAQINVYLSVQPPSDAVTCDGWVMAYVNSGQAPYTYVWNDVDTSYGDSFFPEYDTLWNLCPGVYTLDLYDSNNDSLHIDFFLTSNDFSFGDTTGAPDTIQYLVEDCSIDYSIPVDTAYMTGVSIVSDFMVTDADSIFVQWNVVQGATTTEIYDTLIGYFPLGSDFVIDAGIYCPDSAQKMQVKVIRILGFVSHSVGILEEEQLSARVFPNPFSDYITLDGIEDGEVVIRIFDLQGKVIRREERYVSNEFITLSLPDMKNGIYFLEANTSGGVYKAKLIKR